MSKFILTNTFLNQKLENELMEIIGFYSTDSKYFIKIKKIAIYKFADF